MAYSKEDIAIKLKEGIFSKSVKIEPLEELTKPISPENGIGTISRMDAINNKSINEVALRKLKALKITLENVHDNDLGKCNKCNIETPIKRILLTPYIKHCVNRAHQQPLSK